MFSNRYIFIYSTVLVVIVAVVLAVAATSLKPFQDQNVRIEKIQNLLMAANIESTTENAEKLYADYVKEELAVDINGNVISRYADNKLEGEIRPFDINLKEQQYLRKKGENAVAPIYALEKDGQKSYIIPMLGNGLWGSISGNIALADDFNTVIGVTFDHAGETPGLGAEIATPQFQSKFKGKRIFDGNRFVGVEVVKAGLPVNEHSVDGISGGTITSVAVGNMLLNCLGNYQAYFEKQKTAQKPVITEEIPATDSIMADSTMAVNVEQQVESSNPVL